MSAVAGAALPVFSSLDSSARCVSSNVALCLSLRSSPSPNSSKNLNLSARRYKSLSRRRIVEAKVSSFSIHSDDEDELGYGYEGAEGVQFANRRNATWRSAREESSWKARVSGASHEEDNPSWIPQKQETRGAKPFDIQKARGSMSLENARAPRNHDRDNAVAYNKRSGFLPFEEQQLHGSSVAQKHHRVPLRTKNQRSRMHNNVSVFEGIRQPSISGLSSNNRADASSWGVEDADVAPNFKRHELNSYEDSRRRVKYSQQATQHGIKENIRRGAKFMSKLEEVVSNLKKKDDLSSAMNQEALRDENTFTHAGQGVQTATSGSKKAEKSGVFGSVKRNEKQIAKSVDSDTESSARDANTTIARDDSRGFPLMNDGKGLQSEPGEARSLLKKNARVDNEAGVTCFNLFSSSPSVPWEADRKYASTSKPRIPIRRGNVSTVARRSFTSVGSRSSRSRPSVNSRNISYSNIDSHAATGVVEFIGGDEQMESRLENREGIELNDDKFTTQIASQKGAPKAEEQVERVNFDWSESDAEENGENALSMHLSTEEIDIDANASTKSSLSAASPHSIFDWDDSDNEDNTFSIDSDVEDDVAPEFDSIERSHHNKKDIVYSINSDVEAAEPPEFDVSERSLHNKKEILSSSMTNTKSKSAVFPTDTILGASKMGNGSNASNFAGWHKHNSSDLPFEFQFSYSETPKAPIIGYRETPYSPFGPSTAGRPWTGGPPPKPSKKKPRVFDSFKPPPKDKKGVKFVQDPGPYPEGQGPKPAKSREEIMGEPLTKEEIIYLVEKCERESRQLNLGRDGLTHNMLDLIHCHWKRRRVCKIKCKGVPTLDMDNVKFHIEDKTGGKIIYQAGGVLYLFRGRNYNYKDRPQIPLMLWKPVAPLYPKLIQPDPEGLTKEEAKRLRVLGRKVQPICKLGKNGVYLNLVKDVRAAFKLDELVCIDCQGLNPRDYKKIGAKLKDLVPCVLLSFDKEHILMWKGKHSGHASEGKTEEKMHQSYSEQEPGSMPDYASQEVSTHSSNAEATSVPQFAKEQVQFHRANIDETLFSSSSRDEGHATTDRRLQQETESEGTDAAFEKMSKSEDGDKELVPLQAAASKKSFTHAVEDGLVSQEEEINKCLDNQTDSVVHGLWDHTSSSGMALEISQEGLVSQEEEVNKCLDNETDSVVRLDALWDHAFSSGMALEISQEGMDADVIVRKAAQLAQLAPLGPTYTTKLMYKLRLKRDGNRPNDILQVQFGRGKPHKLPKKVVKRKFQLPTLDVPGMGGLPVDELARLLAPPEMLKPKLG